MRKHSIVACGLLLCFASIVIGCGGGGGGSGSSPNSGSADTFVFARDGGLPVSYIETTSMSNLTGYDPYMYAYYHPASARTFVNLFTAYTGDITTGHFNETVEIHFGTSSPGVYTVGTGSTFLGYSRQLPGLSVVASSGTITVTSYGPVGGRIEGVYSAASGTRTLSGSFSVTREADH